MTPEEWDAHIRMCRVMRKYRAEARTHVPTIGDRLEYFWFNWGNDICKVLFAAIAIAWMMFALYLWGPMIRAGLGSYLNG